MSEHRLFHDESFQPEASRLFDNVDPLEELKVTPDQIDIKLAQM